MSDYLDKMMLNVTYDVIIGAYDSSNIIGSSRVSESHPSLIIDMSDATRSCFWLYTFLHEMAAVLCVELAVTCLTICLFDGGA